jgi:hypothetical protein
MNRVELIAIMATILVSKSNTVFSPEGAVIQAAEILKAANDHVSAQTWGQPRPETTPVPLPPSIGGLRERA